jgi:hypothetical protein
MQRWPRKYVRHWRQPASHAGSHLGTSYPATLYADGIVGAIDESSILVLILSKDAVASAHVGRELERAASKRHPIIALRTDTAALTRAFEYFLNQSQWIEVGAGGTAGAIAQLVEAVGRHLSPGSAAAPTQASQTPTRKAATSRLVWVIAVAFVALAVIAAYFLAYKAGACGLLGISRSLYGCRGRRPAAAWLRELTFDLAFSPRPILNAPLSRDSLLVHCR